jgi:hypothetical protein
MSRSTMWSNVSPPASEDVCAGRVGEQHFKNPDGFAALADRDVNPGTALGLG